jgi:hypothetical protein
MASMREGARHDLGGPGWPDSSGASDTWGSDGRRYVSDVRGHRVVVEEANGRRWTFGREGVEAGELRCPRGVALIEGATPASTRVFVCDSLNHRVQVFDGTGVPRFAFGGHGDGPGQFVLPADIAIVTPQLPGDDRADALDDPLLAVADRGNGRVQVVRFDGSVMAIVGAAPSRPPGRPNVLPEAGWPFFRLWPDPVIPHPVRVAWDEPWLAVTCDDGRRVRVDLALAMLPSFAAWRERAHATERARAFRYHASLGSRRRAVPPGVLTELALDTVAA